MARLSLRRVGVMCVLGLSGLGHAVPAVGQEMPDESGRIGPAEAPPPPSMTPSPPLPPGSCAAQPLAAHCPIVERVVRQNVDVKTKDGGSAFAPIPTASASRRRIAARIAQDYSPGFACAVNSFAPVNVTYPSGNVVVRGSAANSCRSGVGVSYQELILQLDRYQSSSWTNLNTNIFSRGGAGTINGTAQYDCHHQSFYAYRSFAWGYAVVNGIGYLSAPDGAYANRTCWP